jgi:polyisoprenoid-binding protein YceI
MTRHRTPFALALAVAISGLTTSLAAAADGADAWTPVEVRGGTATFEANTSISAISVHGKSNQLTGTARLREGSDGLALEGLDAMLPVQSLNTGMGLRDEHMRRYVFTTPDGKVPDLHFTSQKAACTQAGTGRATCTLEGAMTIRGNERPFKMQLAVTKAGPSFRAAGDTVVKLSTWGIERPSQFGVTTEDDVKLHLEFVAQPSATTTAENRGGR